MKEEKTYTPAGQAFTELILATFRFNGQLLAAGDRLTQELGLSSALWQVLGAIGDGPLSMAQIARNMGLTRQSVRRTVGVLKERGFVEFQENPDHQRAKLIALTGQGRTVLDKAAKINIEWSNRITRGLNVSELKTAIKIMRTLGDLL